MRIIFGHELFPPDFAGGGEKLMLRLTKWLASHGRDVEVVTSGDPAVKSYEGVRTVRISANRYLMNVAGLLPMVMRGRTADIVQTSSGNMCLPSYAAARLLGKPSVCWVHHVFGKYWRDIRGPLSGRVFELMERVMLTRGFDALVFQNESSMRIGLSMGIDPKKVRMITPGVDLDVFSPAKSVKRDGSVLFVGSLVMDEPAVRTKGMEYVLEAAAMLPDVEFRIMGRYAKRMEHTPNVRFVGTTDQKGLVRMYRKAGVVVCASLNEGFGIALLEAMACGCPIVSTVDIGQAGPKPAPRDGRALANAIRGYAGSAKAAADGRRNVTAARKHTWDNFYTGFERIYDVLNKHRSK